MAWEIPGFSWTRLAGEDLSDSQGCGVNLDGNSEVVLPSDGARIIGVVRNKPVEGQSATLVSTGIVKGRVGATGVQAGDNVSVDAEGRFVQATANDVGAGVAIEDADEDQYSPILLTIGAGNVVATS